MMDTSPEALELFTPPEGPLDLHVCIEELRRELRLRRSYYPRAVKAGRLSAAAANRQYGRLVHALRYLEQIRTCHMRRICCEGLER